MIPAGSPIAGQASVLPPQVGANPAGLDAAIAAAFGNPVARATNDPYTDDAALIKKFKEFHRLSFENRWTYERNWWRNLLYTLGRQWIFYNQQRGAWQDKRMQKWVPRPVTNKIAETLDSMRSVFLSVELGVKVRPLSDGPDDTQTDRKSVV